MCGSTLPVRKASVIQDQEVVFFADNKRIGNARILSKDSRYIPAVGRSIVLKGQTYVVTGRVLGELQGTRRWAYVSVKPKK